MRRLFRIWKKRPARILIKLTLLLIATYLLSEHLPWQARHYVNNTLLTVDTSAVNTMLIIPPGGGPEEISFNREGGHWLVTQGFSTNRALDGPIREILQLFSHLESDHLLALKPTEWPGYGIDDARSSRVRLYHGQQILADLLIGNERTDVNGQRETYIRFPGKRAVFLVPVACHAVIDRPFNDFRDRLIYQFDYQNIKSIQLEYPCDSIRYWERRDTAWYEADGKESIQLPEYPDRLFASNFEDGFIEPVTETEFYYRLVFRPSDETDSLEIMAWKLERNHNPYVIRCNQRPDAYFCGDSIFVNRLFIFANLQPPDHDQQRNRKSLQRAGQSHGAPR